MALLGCVITIISSGIYEYIKEKPILSSFKFLFQWIWNNIFEFEIKICEILIMLIFIAIIIVFIENSNNTKKPKSKADFTDYIRDKIQGTKLKWNWEHNFFEGKWEVCKYHSYL